MSVICQNFVQNAWKKDLCSNCFKSLSDHDVSCVAAANLENHRSTNNLPTSGYISQATTIYQSRGLLNHATWTSLLTERQQDKGNGAFKLENGFHGKLLTISPNGTPDRKVNGILEIQKVNGVSGGHQQGLQNGGSHAITNGILKASRSPSGKKKPEGKSSRGQVGKVGFKEGGVQVIGYGGNDYDSDDNDWEPGSPDDNEFPLECLDSTDEDRAISRITRENTEFNSKNDNLLQTGLVASCLKQQNKSDDLEQKTKNINGCCRDDVTEDENSSGGRKVAAGVPNGLSSRPPQSQRREAPPQASVKPMLRNEGQNKNKVVQGDITRETTNNVNNNIKNQTNGDATVEVVHESVIVLVDSAITPPGQTTTTMSIISGPTKEDQNGDAKPRPSFLHGTPSKESRPSDNMATESAIYTPSKTELFLTDSPASSKESSPMTGSLHERQRSISENDLTAYQSSSGQASPAAACSQRVSKPDYAISDSNLSAGSKNEPIKCAAPNSNEKEFTGSCLSREESSPALARPSPPAEEQAVYYAVSNTIIHTEVQRPSPHVATIKRQVSGCHYAESNVYQETNTEVGNSRSSPNNRETKLAALAQELEQARHGSNQKRQAPSPPKVAETSPPPSTVNAPATTPTKVENRYGYSTIYGKPAHHSAEQLLTNKSSSGKTKSATISSVQGKKVLALLTLDDTAAKTNKKGGKFSLKKFLKRGKDLESIDNIFHNGSSPNPKAWKQNSDFDRSRLKLEIIHPMDMAGSKEVHSTNPAVSPDGHYASTSLPSFADSASSCSRLTVDGSWTGDLSSRNETYSTSSESTCKNSGDGIYDDDTTWQVFSPAGESPLPTSGSSCAGEMDGEMTPTLSTFSPTGSTAVCLPSMDSPSSPEPIYGSHRPISSSKPVRPPKPPPPPRIRPFSPTAGNTDEIEGPSEGKSRGTNSKPQVPKRHSKLCSKTDYANLGEVRNPMAPQKPDRSPTSPSLSFKGSQDNVNNYEPIDVHHQHRPIMTSQESMEETPYYEMYEDIYQEGSSVSQSDYPIKEPVHQPPHPVWRDSDKVTLTVASPGGGGGPPGRGDQHSRTLCGSNSAWLSLEQSYAIVAAANHEVLAKLIGQVVQQRLNGLSKEDGQPLCWSDFTLQTSQPLRIVGGEKTVFNAFFRHPSKREVTLVVAAPPSSLSNQESPSKHIFLATFLDNLPTIACAWDAEKNGNDSSQQAMIHVLPKSDVTSVHNFFLDNKEKQRSQSFEKEFCFVFLQLIQALKILQAHGTEEVDMNLEHLLLSKGEQGHISSLVLFSSDFADGNKVALCQYALKFMLTVLSIDNTDNLSTNDCHPTLSPAARKIFITVAKVLTQEKASSLSKAKNLLEFHLWGPREYIYSLLHGTQGVEDTLQRWLDIERANSLRLLVKNQKNITAFEEQQHQFLVQTSAKILKDLSSSLCFEKL